MRKELKTEIDSIRDHEKKGAREFLNFISKEYVSYENKKVEFTEEDLKES